MSSQFSQQVIGFVSLIGFVLSVLSWIGSVYVWARIPKRSFLNYVALPILVLFGFLVGWVYLLFRSDVLTVENQTEGGVVDAPDTP
jgi:L-asparagine transporter-like permease